MDKGDVVDGFTGSTSGSGRGGRMARTSRKSSTTASTLTLIHAPTGIRVVGTVPAGHYTRTAMIAERKRLRAELWTQLEGEVAKSMRLPGR